MDCKSIRNLVSASVISLVLSTSCEGITGPASADDFPWDPQEEAIPEEPVIKSLEDDEDWGRVTYHGIPVIYVRILLMR